MERHIAERPQSLNITRNSINVAGDSVLPVHSGTDGSRAALQGQATSAMRYQAERLNCDILEQSLRAANVLGEYSSSVPQQPRAGASMSVACTSTSSVAASVTHPSGLSVDCVLDYSQQQRLNRRQHSDNNNNSSVLGVHSGRHHSLSDIVTPTSDVTTVSSPSESLSQVTWSIAVSLSVF